MGQSRQMLQVAIAGFAVGFGFVAFQSWEKPWTDTGNLLTLLGSGLAGAVIALMARTVWTRTR